MDRPKRCSGPGKDTNEISAPLSTTSLSQDTDQIVSSWHRFVRRRDLAQNRAAAAQKNQWLLQRTRALAASQSCSTGTTCQHKKTTRDAALRYLSAFPYPRERSSQDDMLSSRCNADDSDVPEVSLAQSLCYALLVILTGVMALSTAVVLVRLVPAAANSSRISSAQSLNAPS
ncbi:hypothetical protein MTO96_039987, partial [Rhipicephalus appendiculatus]